MFSIKPACSGRCINRISLRSRPSPQHASQQLCASMVDPIDTSSEESKGIWLDQRINRSRGKFEIELDPPPVLSGVRVVLVAPKNPKNIGAAARACENFECFDLVVVAPRCDVSSNEALTVACGSTVLDRVRVFDNVKDAVADVDSAIALTRRSGRVRPVAASISELTLKHPGLFKPPVSAGSGASMSMCALVFGREEDGLSAQELSECTHLCAIPTGRTQPSMNLSHAVASVLCQCFERVSSSGIVTDDNTQKDWRLEAASISEVEALMRRLRGIASKTGLREETVVETSNGNRRSEIGQLRAVLDRAGLTVGEVRTLHSLFKAIGNKL